MGKRVEGVETEKGRERERKREREREREEEERAWRTEWGEQEQ
jgi:hypothetical protein